MATKAEQATKATPTRLPMAAAGEMTGCRKQAEE